MNTPKKFGNVYVKLKDEYTPEYFFQTANGSKIGRFMPMKNKDVHDIILPQLQDVETAMPKISKYADGACLYDSKKIVENYILGRAKICEDCFDGIKKLRITVPFESSIKLEQGCFDKDADVELVLHKNLTLKEVQRVHYTGFDYKIESWLLICDKKIPAEFSMGGFGYDQYLINDYNSNRCRQKIANIKISQIAEQVEREI